MRSLILIGYRGTGKSSLGKRLSRLSGLPFLDTDSLIVQRAGRSIPEIFAADGEVAFREMESRALEAALADNAAVVATGGGIVLDRGNRRLMAEAGFVVWLWAPAEVLHRRIHKDSNRPALTGLDPLEEVRTLLERRRPLYAEVADLELDTSSRPFDEVAVEIEAAWRGAVKG